MSESSVYVTAAERTMLILEQLSTHAYINLEDLAKECDLPKATLYRFLQTLTLLGYVRRNENDQYSLTLRMFSIGSTSLEHTDLLTVARPVAQELSDFTGETVHIGMLEKTKAVYVLKIESAHTIRMFSRVGKHIPLHCTAIGKIILADMADEKRLEFFKKLHKDTDNFERYTQKTFVTDQALNHELDEVKKQGYAQDKEEHEDGITCIGAPIKDVTGKVIAAISVSYPCFRFPTERFQEIVDCIKKAAKDISLAVGYKE